MNPRLKGYNYHNSSMFLKFDGEKLLRANYFVPDQGQEPKKVPALIGLKTRENKAKTFLVL